MNLNPNVVTGPVAVGSNTGKTGAPSAPVVATVTTDSSSGPGLSPVLTIFMVEVTSKMGPYYNGLLSRYIIPLCHQIKNMGSKKTEFALITYGGFSHQSRRTIEKYSFTFDLELMIKRVSEIDFSEEFLDPRAFNDALMCTLELFDLHRHSKDSRKYCILVANSPISLEKRSLFQGLNSLAGKNCLELADEFSLRHIFFSLIIPRLSSNSLKKVYKKINAWNSDASTQVDATITKTGELIGLSGLKLLLQKEELHPHGNAKKIVMPSMDSNPSNPNIKHYLQKPSNLSTDTKPIQQSKPIASMNSGFKSTTTGPMNTKPPRIVPESNGTRHEAPQSFLSPALASPSLTPVLSRPSSYSNLKVAPHDLKNAPSSTLYSEDSPYSTETEYQKPQLTSLWSSSNQLPSMSQTLPSHIPTVATSPSRLVNLDQQLVSTQHSRVMHSHPTGDSVNPQTSGVREPKTLVGTISSHSHMKPNPMQPTSIAGTFSSESMATSSSALGSTQQAGSFRSLPYSSSAAVAATGNQTTIWTGKIFVESLSPILSSPVSFNAIAIHLCRSEEESPNLSFMEPGSWPIQLTFKFCEGNQTQDMKERLFRNRKRTTFILLPQDRLDSDYSALVDVLTSTRKFLVSMVIPGKMIVIAPHISNTSKRLVAVVLEPKPPHPRTNPIDISSKVTHSNFPMEIDQHLDWKS